MAWSLRSFGSRRSMSATVCPNLENSSLFCSRFGSSSLLLFLFGALSGAWDTEDGWLMTSSLGAVGWMSAGRLLSAATSVWAASAADGVDAPDVELFPFCDCKRKIANSSSFCDEKTETGKKLQTSSVRTSVRVSSFTDQFTVINPRLSDFLKSLKM